MKYIETLAIITKTAYRVPFEAPDQISDVLPAGTVVIVTGEFDYRGETMYRIQSPDGQPWVAPDWALVFDPE